MPEDSIIDDELISQDDIDKLLDASVNNDKNEADDGSVSSSDEFAELSQYDIDNLLNGTPLGTGSSPEESGSSDELYDSAEPDTAEQSHDTIGLSSKSVSGDKSQEDDGLELISQDDIDQLMNGFDTESSSSSLKTDSDTTVAVDNDDDDDDDDLSFISREDIEKLVKGTSLSGESDDTPVVPAEFTEQDTPVESTGTSGETDGLDLVSQEDIDKLMNDLSLDSDDSTVNTEDEDESINDKTDDTLDDINDISHNESDTTDVSSDDNGKIAENEYHHDKLERVHSRDNTDGSEVLSSDTSEMSSLEQVIDESEAVDIEDCFITQDIIDKLFSEDIPDKELVSEDTDAATGNDFVPESDLDIDAGSESDRSKVSDRQIESDGDIAEPEVVADEDNSPIDNLDDLLEESSEAVDGESDEVSNLISQEDIDQLLKGTEEDEEDILGDIDGSTSLQDKDLGDDSIFDSDGDNQVVIEEAEEDEELFASDSSADGTYDSDADTRKAKSGKHWYKSKLVLAGLGTFILFLFFGSGYFFFFYGHQNKAELNKRKLSPDLAAERRAGGLNSDFDAFPKITAKQGPGTVVMKDFIILSPVENKKITYISADISVHYSKGQAFYEIKKHLPFYRGVIYNAVQNVLKPGNTKKITEKELAEIIKNALNQVMSGKYIDRVFFISFKTG